jgi:Sulfotransferase family
MQLILIGGAQRSGTTLLQTLLANALDEPVLPEAHILCDMLASFKRAKETSKKTRFYYHSDADLLSFFRFCANRHMADLVQHVGARSVLVLKDPNFVQVEAEAAAVLPEAIRVVCVRDPRDIAASFLRIGQRQQQEAQASKYRRRDVHFIANKILSSYEPLLGQRAPPSVRLIHYEALATNPEQTLKVLASESGLELDIERIRRPIWLDAEARHELSWISELEGQRASPANVGAYRAIMRPNEIALIEQICGSIMAWAGYEKSVLSVDRSPTTIARRLLDWLRRTYSSYRERFYQL